MTDKGYVLRFAAITLLNMVLLTLVIWLIPEKDYFDGEYPFWKQQKDYTHTFEDKPQVLFIGDSAFKAAVIPDLIGNSAYNLSLGGAGPIEMYYSLKNYLENHPKPQRVFFSFKPMHFTYLDRYRDRTLYFHFLSPQEQIESQLNIFSLDDMMLLDKWSMSIDNLHYMVKFPTKYFHTIKDSELKRGHFNEEHYQQAANERGHMFFGRNPEWFKHYEIHKQLKVDFKLLQVEDFYLRKLFHLCLDNDIPFDMVQTPINQITYSEASKYNYFPTYQEYLQNLSKEFNINIESELIFYDVTLFGDELHLNEKGAEIYSNALKSKYNL